MALAWTEHPDVYSSFAMLEQTRDSEDDAVDRRVLIHDALDVSLPHEEDDDDAESYSCDSWGAIGAAESVCDDVGESENGFGDAAGWAYWEAAMSEDPPSPMEEEEEGSSDVVGGISRNAIEAMEDKEFWEACLAVGY